MVVRELGHLRETGRLPWEWITDGTRMVRKETQYDSLDDALERATESYRPNLWASQSRRVEVWCETQVLYPVTVVARRRCRSRGGEPCSKLAGTPV